jgi:uncharacterized protein YoxC
MDTIMTFSVAVIALCMVVIMVAAAAALWRVRRAATKAEELLEAIKLQIAPVIHDVTLISAGVRKAVQRIESASEKIEEGAHALLDVAQDVKDFEARLRERIEEPIVEITAFISGMLRGAQAFGRIFWRR